MTASEGQGHHGSERQGGKDSEIRNQALVRGVSRDHPGDPPRGGIQGDSFRVVQGLLGSQGNGCRRVVDVLIQATSGLGISSRASPIINRVLAREGSHGSASSSRRRSPFIPKKQMQRKASSAPGADRAIRARVSLSP